MSTDCILSIRVKWPSGHSYSDDQLSSMPVALRKFLVDNNRLKTGTVSVVLIDNEGKHTTYCFGPKYKKTAFWKLAAFICVPGLIYRFDENRARKIQRHDFYDICTDYPITENQLMDLANFLETNKEKFYFSYLLQKNCARIAACVAKKVGQTYPKGRMLTAVGYGRFMELSAGQLSQGAKFVDIAERIQRFISSHPSL